MHKKVLGYGLLVMGLAAMGISGYLFVTGSGARSNLLEVICYLMVGATCFFSGISHLFDSAREFTEEHLPAEPELEEVSLIQQQWRTIHIARRPSAVENGQMAPVAAQRSNTESVSELH